MHDSKQSFELFDIFLTFIWIKIKIASKDYRINLMIGSPAVEQTIFLY